MEMGLIPLSNIFSGHCVQQLDPHGPTTLISCIEISGKGVDRNNRTVGYLFLPSWTVTATQTDAMLALTP